MVLLLCFTIWSVPIAVSFQFLAWSILALLSRIRIPLAMRSWRDYNRCLILRWAIFNCWYARPLAFVVCYSIKWCAMMMFFWVNTYDVCMMTMVVVGIAIYTNVAMIFVWLWWHDMLWYDVMYHYVSLISYFSYCY